MDFPHFEDVDLLKVWKWFESAESCLKVEDHDWRVERARHLVDYVRLNKHDEEKRKREAEIVENITVDLFLSLVTLLVHPAPYWRSCAVKLILELSMIFDKSGTLGRKEMNRLYSKVVSMSTGDDMTAFQGISVLFEKIGHHLSVICAVITSSLEALLVNNDMELRKLGVVVVSELIVANPEVFSLADSTKTLWDVLMELEGGMSGMEDGSDNFYVEQHGKLRVVVLKAAEKLSKSIMKKDPSSCMQMLTILLKRKPTSVEERDALAVCMKKLVSTLSATGLEADLYSIFISSLYNKQENIHETLYDAIRECVRSSPQNVQSKNHVLVFLNSLERFMFAQQPRLRYGALICVNAVLSAFPLDLLNVTHTSMFPYLLSECLDHCQSCMVLALASLKLVIAKLNNRSGNEGTENGPKHKAGRATVLKESIPQIVLDLINQHEKLVLADGPGGIKAVGSYRAFVKRIVTVALPLCKNLSESTFVRLSSGLQYLSRSERIQRMEILSLWAGKISDSMSMLVNNLLIGIRESDATTGVLAVDIFSSLTPNLCKGLNERDLSVSLSANPFYHSICGIETVFRQVLQDCSDEMVMSIVSVISGMPFEYFEETRLEQLLQMLLLKSFTSRAYVRTHIYDFIKSCSRFWKTTELRHHVICSLICCLGEGTVHGVDIVSGGLMELLNECDFKETATILQQQAQKLVAPDMETRIPSFNRFINRLARPDMDPVRALLLSDVYLIQLAKLYGYKGDLDSFTEEQKVATGEKRQQIDDGNVSQSPLFILLCILKLGEGPGLLKWASRFLENEMEAHDVQRRMGACWGMFSSFQTFDGRPNMNLIAPFVLRMYEILTTDEDRVPGLSVMIQICTMLIPLSIAGLNRILLRYFLKPLLDLLVQDATNYKLRICCIKFIVALIKARPKAMFPFLSEVRDSLRSSFASPQGELLDVVLESYPVVAEYATKSEVDAETYFQYFVADLGSLRQDEDNEWAGSSDPLIAKLTASQLNYVLRGALRAIGMIKHENLAPKVIDLLLDIIHHPDADFRYEALKAILHQSEHIRLAQQVAVRWLTLPLVTDVSPNIRGVFSEVIENLEKEKRKKNSGNDTESDHNNNNNNDASGKRDRLLDRLSEADEDDCEEDTSVLFEKLTILQLEKEPFIQLRGKLEPNQSIFMIQAMDHSPTGGNLNGESERLAATSNKSVKLETSEELLEYMRTIAAKYCGEMDPACVEIVEYHMHQYMHTHSVNGSAALLLSEIAHRLVLLNQKVDNPAHKDKVKAILTALFLNVCRPDASAVQQKTETTIEETEMVHALQDRNLILGSALGICNIARVNPEDCVPFVVENLCSLGKLELGHLLTLKYILSLFQGNKEKIEKLLPPENARVVTSLLLDSIQTRDIPMDTKKAALDLIGETAMLAGPQELSNVVRCIISILEENSDATIHALSQQQLSRVFETFESDHPLVESLIEYVNTGLLSTEMNKRQRSFTLLCIVSKPMGPARSLPGYLRALADPEPRIRQLAMKSLLRNPPEFISKTKNFFTGVRNIANQMELDRAATETQGGGDDELGMARTGKRDSIVIHSKRPRRHSDARLSISVAPSNGPSSGLNSAQPNQGIGMIGATSESFSFPLPDDDPMNATFLKSDSEYKALLEQYGFDSSSFVHGLLGISASALREDRDKGNTLQNGISDRSFATLMKGDTVPIIRLLLSLDASVATTMMKSLNQDLVHCFELVSSAAPKVKEDEIAGSNEEEKKIDGTATHRPSTEDQQPELPSPDALAQLIHHFKIHAKLLQACDVFPPEAKDALQSFQQVVETCGRLATYYRRISSMKMSEVTIISVEDFDLPFVSMEHFSKFQEYREFVFSTEDSEVSNQRELMAKKREEIQKELTQYNRLLFLVSGLHQLLIQGIGVLYGNLKTLGTGELVRGYDWLMAQLTENEHRQLREVSRDAVVEMSSSTLPRDEFKRYVADSLGKIKHRLETNRPDNLAQIDLIYRAKVDLMAALVQLLPNSDSPNIYFETIQILVKFWDDPDSYVQHASIQLTESLSQSNPSQFARLFVGDGPLRINFRDQVSRRIQDPSFPHKEALNRFLQSSYAGKE